MRAPVQTSVRSRQRRFARVAVVGVLLLAGLPGLRAYLAHCHARELQLASAIFSTGGRVELGPPFRDRITAILKREKVRGTRVFLGRGCDDEWIRQHDQLQDLNIQMLTIGDVDLSGAGLAALLAEHPVTTLLANREELTDDALAALAGNGKLRELAVAYSSLTDDQLSLLPLEQLERLDISGTRVTFVGVRQLARCGRLRELDIDGNQLTPGAVATLNSMKSLERLKLCGPDVTDHHVQLLRGLDRQIEVSYWSTSTSEEAQHDLRLVLRGRKAS